MTLGNLITELRKYFDTSLAMNIAVSDHRQGHDEWNWYDSAKNLLNQLNKAK